MKTLPALLAISLTLPACAGADEEARAVITAEAIRADVEVLSSDDFEGRAPGGHGEDLTITHIRSAFMAAGLQPAFGNSYYQPFDLATYRRTSPGNFELTHNGQPIAFEVNEDYVAYSGQPVEDLSFTGSRLVFGGFGIRAAEEDWDDYADVDLSGATVVLFRGDPGIATGDEDLFQGGALSVHGLLGSKADLAAELGAEAVFLIHTTQSAGYPWESLSSGGTGSVQYSIQEENDDKLTLFAHISEPTARRLFTEAGLDYDEVYAAAAQRGFTAIETDIEVSGEMTGEVTSTTTRNVVGMIEGSTRPDECIIYSAHWDHMGINLDAPTDDTLFNGALDNAVGTSMLINIARAYGRLEQAPERSVYFFATAAEERGLLGAEYFVDHPPCERRNIVGALNMDAHFPYADSWEVMVVPGLGTNDLMVELEAIAADYGRVLIDDPNPAAGGFYRSDHYPFIAAGIPGLYAVGAPSEAQVEADPSINEGFAWYMANGYHHASDEIDRPGPWRMGGIAQDAHIYFDLGLSLANSEDWPNFTEGTPWRATRDDMRNSD